MTDINPYRSRALEVVNLSRIFYTDKGFRSADEYRAYVRDLRARGQLLQPVGGLLDNGTGGLALKASGEQNFLKDAGEQSDEIATG